MKPYEIRRTYRLIFIKAEYKGTFLWQPIIKSIICALAVLLNSIALYKITANRDNPRRTLFLLPFNLALCDLLMALVLPLEIYSTFYGASFKDLNDSVAGRS